MRMNVHSRHQVPGVTWKDDPWNSGRQHRSDEAIRLLRGFVADGRFTKVGFLNAHNANLASSDPEFAEALSDFLILSDGVGVDIAAKLLYGEPFPANLNGTDFIPAFLAAEPRPLTIALLGTTRANADAAAAQIQRDRAAPQLRRHP